MNELDVVEFSKIYTTHAEAALVGAELLRANAAAVVHLEPVESLFMWLGVIQSRQEYR